MIIFSYAHYQITTVRSNSAPEDEAKAPSDVESSSMCDRIPEMATLEDSGHIRQNDGGGDIKVKKDVSVKQAEVLQVI